MYDDPNGGCLTTVAIVWTMIAVAAVALSAWAIQATKALIEFVNPDDVRTSIMWWPWFLVILGVCSAVLLVAVVNNRGARQSLVPCGCALAVTVASVFASVILLVYPASVRCLEGAGSSIECFSCRYKRIECSADLVQYADDTVRAINVSAALFLAMGVVATALLVRTIRRFDGPDRREALSIAVMCILPTALGIPLLMWRAAH